MENEAGIGRHRCQPVGRGLSFLEIALAAALQQCLRQGTRGQRDQNGSTRFEHAVNNSVCQFNSTIDVAEPGLLLCDLDVHKWQSQQCESVTDASLADLSQQFEANFAVRVAPMYERDSPGGSSTNQDPVVTGLLGYLQCFC